MRILVLTTSYPRFPGDVAGRFVADLVEQLRLAGTEVTIVSPADFPHFGIAFGAGIVQNLRARPWRALALPLFFLGFVRAARRAAHEVDVVHAHWLPSALPAITTGKPFLVQLWGSDVELARRLRFFVAPLLRRASCVIGASDFLAVQARALGARSVSVVPVGIELPERVGAPAVPPHVLYLGRLSEEKGILEFLAATEGLPRVIVGDGPLRDRVTEAIGFVAHDRVGEYYERAAVVCIPSRREGYGVVAREAMGYGRPVVATAVGGLRDAVIDGDTGLLVAPRSAHALREAIERLLGDAGLRAQIGKRARERAAADYAWAPVTESLLCLYADASRRTT